MRKEKKEETHKMKRGKKCKKKDNDMVMVRV